MAAVVAVMALLAGSASAVHEVVIEYTVVEGAPGEVIEIAAEEVEPWLQGESCAIEIEIDNNDSVHLGTDVVIESGTDSVVVENVETESGLVTVAAGELVFGETVVASVRLGEDGITSGGIRVDFVCDHEPPAATVAVAPSSTTAPTTAPTTTTTTATAVSPAAAAAVVQAQPDFTG